MRLFEIAAQLKHVEIAGNDNPAILGVTADSRDVKPGYIFAALTGNKKDGAAFITDAVKKNAAAILLSTMPTHNPGIPMLVAEDARKSLGELANILYNQPSQTMDLIGITGTNGKTTTAYIVRHILNDTSITCGMLGTIEYDLGDKREPAPLTTPDAVKFTRSLAEMRDAHCKAAVVEVSSHALDQYRVWPHRFKVGVFTNLSRDHLDYHGSMDQYLEAKHRLFTTLDPHATAILNYGDPAAHRMGEDVKARRFGYILAKDEDEGNAAQFDAGVIPYHARILDSSLAGQTFSLKGPDIEREFHTHLVGRHNVENCVAALLVARAVGIPPKTAGLALDSFPGVPGRLERVALKNGGVAFVDYSHTDAALRSALSVLRPLVKGKLIAVFGCGGDRDKGKRPLMAQAAEEYADRVVVTSDNPRTENPEAIIDEIMTGFAKPANVVRESDRALAVRDAVRMAGPDDAILVAGKGHEDYQIIGTEKIHMDDRELVRNAQ